MKRMISWLLAAMLVSSCGTAPHADLRGESHRTTGSEEEQEGSEVAHYLIGSAIAVVAFCTFGGNAALKVCRKHFMSAEGYKKKIDDAIEVKDGVLFTAYDKTIGKLVRKIKKSDEATNSTDSSNK